MSENYDIAVIGAGIAGASLAASLAPHASVVMLEGEDRPGYHSTGRSAAFWEETYGGPEIFPLTIGSGPQLRDGGFLSQRGAIHIGREADRAAVEAFIDMFAPLGADVRMMDAAQLRDAIPGLRADWCVGSFSAQCADIDVAGLHAHFLADAKRGGAALEVRARVSGAMREGGSWRIDLADGRQVRAKIIANAAGAWADELARIAGAQPIGITPMRRTVAQLRTAPTAPDDMPLVLGINEDFYFKPESGRIWLSPHDETPTVPCDAAPEEMDVAIAIDRLEQAVDWRIEAVERKWAGLRSFAPDRRPVYGFDSQVPGLFWCAGQGGFGIQTSFAGADLAASLLLGVDAQGAGRDIDPADYAPTRFD